MGKKIEFKLDYDENLENFLKKEFPKIVDYRIRSKSLDARGANRGKRPLYQYILDIVEEGEAFSKEEEVFSSLGPLKDTPIIIGAGPAGLFCALRLAEYGIKSILFERGERANKRMKHISNYWRRGELNPDTNVCFGEGGAGLFSDGKLITRIKSPYVQYVMDKFVDFGAPKEVAYISNPHLGSNKIRLLISKMSDELMAKGNQIEFNSKVEELIIDEKSPEKKVRGVRLSDGREFFSSHVILASGHSAKEMYHFLKDKKVPMQGKDFAVGVRIEHPRKHIDFLQYGDYASRGLGSARYRLSFHDKLSGRGSYSFCMCPGGHVLSTGTEKDGIVVNGMSNYARNSPWSNSAMVVSIKDGIDFDSKIDILSGLDFQEQIEKRAFKLSLEKASGKEIPAQSLTSFLKGDGLKKQKLKTSCPSGIFEQNLFDLFPTFIAEHLKIALEKFEKKLPGFITDEALLLAPETRTSAPITIIRDRDTLESIGVIGLYPCGEGAGYAGGITSAAVDGVNVAMSLILKKKNGEIT